MEAKLLLYMFRRGVSQQVCRNSLGLITCQSERCSPEELESVVVAVMGHKGENTSSKLYGKISVLTLKYFQNIRHAQNNYI